MKICSELRFVGRTERLPWWVDCYDGKEGLGVGAQTCDLRTRKWEREVVSLRQPGLYSNVSYSLPLKGGGKEGEDRRWPFGLFSEKPGKWWLSVNWTKNTGEGAGEHKYILYISILRYIHTCNSRYLLYIQYLRYAPVYADILEYILGRNWGESSN